MILSATKTDIWGPCAIISIKGNKYFITIVDDFSLYTWLIHMIDKSSVRKHIINFIAYVENHFNTNIKTILLTMVVSLPCMISFPAKVSSIKQQSWRL